MAYWLLKSEPDTYSIDDLKSETNQTGIWDGVRNYQARNYLRDKMRVGDLAFFYHSSCKEPAIVGIVQITRQGDPDLSAFDAKSPFYDPKSTQQNPRWYMVHVQLKQKFAAPITLKALKNNPLLGDLPLVQKREQTLGRAHRTQAVGCYISNDVIMLKYPEHFI